MTLEHDYSDRGICRRCGAAKATTPCPGKQETAEIHQIPLDGRAAWVKARIGIVLLVVGVAGVVAWSYVSSGGTSDSTPTLEGIISLTFQVDRSRPIDGSAEVMHQALFLKTYRGSYRVKFAKGCEFVGLEISDPVKLGQSGFIRKVTLKLDSKYVLHGAWSAVEQDKYFEATSCELISARGSDWTILVAE